MPLTKSPKLREESWLSQGTKGNWTVSSSWSTKLSFGGRYSVQRPLCRPFIFFTTRSVISHPAIVRAFILNVRSQNDKKKLQQLWWLLKTSCRTFESKSNSNHCNVLRIWNEWQENLCEDCWILMFRQKVTSHKPALEDHQFSSLVPVVKD